MNASANKLLYQSSKLTQTNTGGQDELAVNLTVGILINHCVYNGPRITVLSYTVRLKA